MTDLNIYLINIWDPDGNHILVDFRLDDSLNLLLLLVQSHKGRHVIEMRVSNNLSVTTEITIFFFHHWRVLHPIGKIESLTKTVFRALGDNHFNFIVPIAFMQRIVNLVHRFG